MELTSDERLLEAYETTGGAHRPIPVIDLFAGPGGLGEGFASRRRPDGGQAFQIRLSIEKDPAAHQTLLLRSFYRQFWATDEQDGVPDDYYAFLRGEITRTELFERHPDEAAAAAREAWLVELGVEDHGVVRQRIAEALGPDPGPWVLIGGPPCQAYSLVGRARILGEHRKQQRAEVAEGKRVETDVDPAKAFDADHRHLLYREYLRIIADHRPTVFVMENVPGLLSSKIAGEPVIGRIVRDLQDPLRALSGGELPDNTSPLGYSLSGLTELGASASLFAGVEASARDVRSFVVDASDYGVPQARKRVLIVGVRDDCPGRPRYLQRASVVTVGQAIGDLPKLRSTLSREPDSADARVDALEAVRGQAWFAAARPDVQMRVARALVRISGAGRRALPASAAPPGKRSSPGQFMTWCRDDRMGCTCNHAARAHRRDDLWRYLFAACFADVRGLSPHLRDFPTELLPEHASAKTGGDIRDVAFGDRFRVQVRDRPASTVVSHIARDGHYYIHYDPDQCRALTVREAARLQSFPDNYRFEGNRTQQFGQVGNAVPPLLAYQVARSVFDFMSALGVPARPALRVPVGTGVEAGVAGHAS